MNVIARMARSLTLRGEQRTDSDERLVTRLKQADYTNDRMERRILEFADGSSVAEILFRMTEGLDQVWTAWMKKHMAQAMKTLEKRGFIRVDKCPKI